MAGLEGLRRLSNMADERGVTKTSNAVTSNE